jgi:hypothetical protein
VTAAIAFAQTTLALRDVLQTAMRLDLGWRLTGGAPRVTTLPHGKPDKGSGERLNLGLVAASLSSTGRNTPEPRPETAADRPLAFDLRYLVTAHVLFPLHAELLIGGALQALDANPVLTVAPPLVPSADPFEDSIYHGQGIAPGHPIHISVEPAEAKSFDILRVPALLIRVGPVVVSAAPEGPSLLTRR